MNEKIVFECQWLYSSLMIDACILDAYIDLIVQHILN